MMKQIRVVGTVVADLIARASHLPRPGETLISSQHSLKLRIGGKGFNQAVQAAKALGGDLNKQVVVGFEGCIGKDAFGRMAITELEKVGVKHHLRQSETFSTGTGSIHASSTENCIIVSVGANAETEWWLENPNQLSPFRNADVIIGQLELPLAATLRAFQSAKPGALRILNVAPVPRDFAQSTLGQDILQLSSILVVNQGEAEELKLVDASLSKIDDALHHTSVVIVTLGKYGVRVIPRASEAYNIAATKDLAVDTVGAGDCFTGTLAAHLLLGTKSFQECVQEANKAAGSYVSEVKAEILLEEALRG